MNKKIEPRTVHLKFSESELAEIDNWQAYKGIRTRSEAIRQMIRRTIESDNDNGYQMAEKQTGFLAPARKNVASDTISGDEVKDLIKEEIEKALKAIMKDKFS